MAHYFKYHSLDELDADCRRRGLQIQFTTDLSPLFRPVAIGSHTVGNSLCIQPMEGCDGTLDGRPDELTFRRYRRFGAGGAKLIWGEAAAVVDEGRANPRQLLLNEANAPDFERLLRECRQAHREVFGSDEDLMVGLQLTHSGRYSFGKPIIAFHDPLLDPRSASEGCPLVDDDYLHRLVDHYATAARLAFRAGFQFVDVKQCHRYLLNELLAAKTRPGQYGGSLENRTRVARDIITRIRTENRGAIVASRLNVFDGVPYCKSESDGKGEACPGQGRVLGAWGTNETEPSQPDLREPLAWIGEMQQMGVALINVSMGNPYASPHLPRPFEYPPPDGYEPPEHPLVGVARHFQLASQVQQRFPELPVVGSGYSYLQEYLFHAGAANIQRGRITFVGVGRAALPQPDFARQLQETGRLDRKRVCRTFSYCTALMRSKHNELGQFATGCPPFDKEVYGPLWEQARTNVPKSSETSER